MSYVSLKNRDVTNSRALLLYRSLVRGRSRTLERFSTLELADAPCRARALAPSLSSSRISQNVRIEKRKGGSDGEVLTGAMAATSPCLFLAVKSYAQAGQYARRGVADLGDVPAYARLGADGKLRRVRRDPLASERPLRGGEAQLRATQQTNVRLRSPHRAPAREAARDTAGKERCKKPAAPRTARIELHGLITKAAQPAAQRAR